MKRFITRQFAVYILAANTLLFIAYSPFLERYIHTPDGFRYAWVHGFATDYYLYLSVIQMGKSGLNQFYPCYTTESGLNPSMFYEPFILAGKAAGFLGLPTYAAYHLFKVISAEIFFVALYGLSTVLLGRKTGFLAAILSLTLTTVPEAFMEQKLWKPYMPWWFWFNAIERIDNLPHHLFGLAFMLLSVAATVLFLRSKKTKHLIAALFTGAIHTVIFPPSALIPVFVLPVAYLVTLTAGLSAQKKKILGLGTIAIVDLTMLMVIKWQESRGFPWNQWTPWEVTRWNRNEPGFDRALMTMFGLLPITIPPLFILGFRRVRIEMILISLWALLPYIFVPLTGVLNLPKLRLVQIAPFVPYGLALAYFLQEWGKSGRVNKILSSGVIILVLFSFGSAVKQYKVKIDEIAKIDSFYLPVGLFEAYDFINARYMPQTAGLASSANGLTLPAFSPVKVYVGQLTHTMNYFIKEEVANNFFQMKYRDEEALLILRQNNIEFVFFGTYEKQISGKDSLSYRFLTPVFNNEQVIIYEILE